LGQTITSECLSLDSSDYFRFELDLFDWLCQFSDDTSDLYIRGYLGKMLFAGEVIHKCVDALSGG
jgi:ATPase subunit of ABC transporter with duplicated ATPase domains